MTSTWICRFSMVIISVFGFAFVYIGIYCTDVFSFCRFLQLFYNCFYNCYTVLIFALSVANWPFCINKFDLIWTLDHISHLPALHYQHFRFELD